MVGEDIRSWTLTLCRIDNIVIDTEERSASLLDERAELYVHQMGDNGNEYFGWQDTRSANAEELAEAICSRCANLLNKCHQDNQKNIGWFTQLLGFVEQNKSLPVPYGLGNHHSWTFELGVPHFVDLPPAIEVITDRNVKYQFERVDINEHRDWHSAHKPHIDAFCEGEVSRLPLYPANTIDVTEMGAYWEGAVYFVEKYLAVTSTKEFLLFLEAKKDKYQYGRWFFSIYDSHSQLDYFVAHVVRLHLRKDTKSSNSIALDTRWQKWLRYFENKRRPMHDEVPFHNPYYGGENPLHLGMISNSWLE